MIERRVVPRLKLGSEQFRLSSNGKVFSVRDLSRNGMGLRLLDPEDRFLFPVGTGVEGILNIDHERIRICAHVVRSQQEQVGLRFDEVSPEIDRLLQSLMDPDRMGQRLRPLPVSGTAQEVFWYHGPFSTDVVYWTGPEPRILVSLFGGFVQWTEAEGIRTGTILRSDSSGGAAGLVFWESVELRFDPEVDQEKRAQVARLIRSSSVHESIKERIT